MSCKLSVLRELLRDVCAGPADDVPRRIYADYLEDHGDDSEKARAEFIRLQLARAAACPRWGGPCDCDWCGAKRLWQRWRREWTRATPAFEGACDLYSSWGGGFLEDLRITQEAVLFCGRAVPSLIPLRRVRLSGKSPHRTWYYRGAGMWFRDPLPPRPGTARGQSRAEICAALFARLKGGNPLIWKAGGTSVLLYGSRTLAKEALAEACLEYCREGFDAARAG